MVMGKEFARDQEVLGSIAATYKLFPGEPVIKTVWKGKIT